jgi:hypothetical protein
VRSHTKASSVGARQQRQRRSIRLTIGFLAAVIALLAIAPSAMAVLTRAKTASFGPDGTSGSTFLVPGTTSGGVKQLAFDQANGTLYALDKNESAETGQMYAFDAPALTPLGGSFPLATGNLNGEPDLAVDNSALASAGHIFLVRSAQGDVLGVDDAGTPLGGNFPIDPAINPGSPFAPPKELCGAGVDSAGHIWVTNGSSSTAGILEYDPTASFQDSFSTAAQGSQPPCGVAFDSNNDMFVALYNDSVWKYQAPTYTTATKIFDATEGDAGTYPREIAIDETAHRLYIVFNGKVSVYNSTTGTFLYDFAGGVPGAQLEDVAIEEATDRVFVSDRGNAKIYAFGSAQNFADASATPTAAKSITDVSAEIGAKITDNGALATTWRLEFSADASASWKTAGSGQTKGGETDAQISTTLSGLLPNSNYQFRVVTNKGPGSSDLTSPSLSFKTVAPPPVISDVGTVNVTDTSVRLVGTIDPRNTETGYVFQYGATPALGSATSLVSIGTATKPITVSQMVGGLNPGTTYYFRLVATNLIGTSESSSHTFTTRLLPPSLPEGRRYEMVTPPDKNLGSADLELLTGNPHAGVARDGQRVGFCTLATFGDPTPSLSGTCVPYVSKRTPAGWQTNGVAPPYCGDQTGPGSVVLSPNFDRAVDSVFESETCQVPPLDPGAPLQAHNLYRQNSTSDPLGSEYDLLTPSAGDAVGGLFVGGSDDFSHLVYYSATNQTDPPDSPAEGDFPKLYEWNEGSLRLVSKDVNDVPLTTSSNLASVYHETGSSAFSSNAISRDGNRIYFQNLATTSGISGGCLTAACDLYMREGGAVTHAVSASECTDDCGVDDSPDQFMWASPSGDRALFASCTKLTNSSSSSVGGCQTLPNMTAGKIYRWDLNSPPGHRLVDISIDGEPADGSQPQIDALVGAGDDGNSVFFIADRQLVPGMPLDPQKPKLYHWSWNEGEPSLDYLATLTLGKTGYSGYEAETDEANWNQARIRVTPDGKYLVLGSYLPLDRVADHDTDKDIYRWSEADGWTCLSCQVPGVPSVADGDAFAGDTVFFRDLSLFRGKNLSNFDSYEPMAAISDDGQTVFFETPDALVPEDVNGEESCEASGFPVYIPTCTDVYEWHDGVVSLVSSGTGSQASYLIGASHSGKDVFFFTRQRLVGWDTDNGSDIYDARVAGGFPEPPAQGVPCEGESCRAGGTSPPTSPGAGSAVFAGPGNPTARTKCAKGSVKRKGKCVRRHRRHRRANHNRRAGR